MSRMNCAICKNVRVTLKYTATLSKTGVAVCDTCYEEFNQMMTLMNANYNSANTARFSANWGTLDDAQRWIRAKRSEVEQLNEAIVRVKTEAEQAKEEMKKKEECWIDYLGGLATAFTEESFSDIQIRPGNGPSIPAHKFLLATRSEVFKHMLSSDTCKSSQIESVCLPEFNHEELETFLEFLYCGNLPKEKFKKHYYCLALASHKYAIPHLQQYCEKHILKLLDSSNALNVLEISEICLNETLRVAAVEWILTPETEIVGSPSFEEFAVQNPHLMVYIVKYSRTQSQSFPLKKRKT